MGQLTLMTKKSTNGGTTMEVYEYKSTDPKQNSNELSVTIYFDTNISKDEAVTQTSLLLGDIGAEYSIDMWSTPMEDE
jgi:hypothetical protein